MAGPRLPLPWLLLTTSHQPAVWRCPGLLVPSPLSSFASVPRSSPGPPGHPPPLDSSSFGSLDEDVTPPQEHLSFPYFSPRLSSAYEILHVFLMDLSTFCLLHPEHKLQVGGGVPTLTTVPCRSLRPGGTCTDRCGAGERVSERWMRAVVGASLGVTFRKGSLSYFIITSSAEAPCFRGG